MAMPATKSGAINATLLSATEPQLERLILPPELQEMIITSGSQDVRARVAFLCKCALVCKAWLSVSRSALALDLVDDSDELEAMVYHLSSPGATLACAIRGISAVWGDPELTYETAALLAKTLPHLPSVVELRLAGDTAPLITFSMTSVRILALHLSSDTLNQISALLPCFPHIDSLELLYCRNVPEVPFGLLGAPCIVPPLRLLRISIFDSWDLKVFGPVVAASRSLQRLTLRLETPESILHTSTWLAKSPRDFASGVHLSVDVSIACSPTNPGMDVVLNAAQSLKVYWDAWSLASLIHWIHKTPHLQVLSLCTPSSHPPDSSMDWEPLAQALRHATHVKELRVIGWGMKYEAPIAAPGYMQSLKACMPPHVSVFLHWHTYNQFESQGSLMEIL